MPTLHIAEFASLGASPSGDGAVDVFIVPPLNEQVISLLNTMTAIPIPFNPLTNWIELCTDSTCSVVFGPYATLSTIATLTSSSGQGRINANERVRRRIPTSPVWGGASSIPQGQVPYGLTAVITT